MKISNETIEEIKSRIDVVDVIGDFIQLKRAGQNYRALSPFADEKTPSFFVFPKNENFKDFSSGKQGDAITFLMELEGLSYVDALVFLAKKYGIEIKEEFQTEEEVQQHNERESLSICLTYARDYFVDNLWKGDEGRRVALTYFSERGFTEETIRKFELGYSTTQWDSLYKNATSKGFTEDILDKAGLVKKTEQGYRDRFNGRVIFPIHNLTGKPIAFGARVIGKAVKQPKYINSPETALYHKSDILYGIFQAKRAVRAEENCYLVEGYTDVISMHQYGVENVVASSGTSLTSNQVKLIKRHADTITVLFDGDAAGIKASLRGIDIILEQGMKVRAVVFPEGEDPDSYSRKLGAMGFREFLKDSTQDFIQFKTQILLQGKDHDPVQKAETINQVMASISLIPDPVLRTVYIQNTSELLEIEEGVLYAELNKILIEKKRGRRVTGPSTPDSTMVEQVISTEKRKSIDSAALQERETIRLLINYGFNKIEDEYHLYDHYLDELEDIEFTTGIYNEILNIFREHLSKGRVIDAEFLIKNGSPVVRDEVIDLVSNKHDLSDNWDKRYHIYVPREEEILHNSVYTNILRLKFHKIKKLIALHLEQLKQESAEEKQTELMKIYIQLKQAEGEFARPLGIVVSG